MSFLKKEPAPSDDPGAKNALNSAGDADACMGMIEAAGGAWFHRGVELSARVAEKCSPSLSRAEEEGSAPPLKMLGLIAEKYGESDIARTDALLEEMGEEPDAKARDRAFVGKWLVAHLRRRAHKAHAVKSLDFEAGWLSRYLSLADAGYTPPEEPADPPPAPAEGEEEGAEAEAEAAAARPLTVATLLASAAQFAAFASDEVESVNIILNFWNRVLLLKQRGTERILSKDTVCNLLTVCETLRGNIGELQKDGQVLDCGMQFLSLAAEMLMAAGMYASLAELLADLIDHLPPKSMVASLALLDTVGGVAGVPEGVLASRDATMEKLFLEDLLYMKLAKCRTLLLENFKEQESFAATIKVTTVKYKNLAKSLLSHNNIPLLTQCLNDLGDIYAAQDDYPAAAVEWNRCIDTICGKHESVHKWRAMFAAHKLIQKCSSSTCLLACNVLGKLMKYCCRTNLRGKVEYGLMAAEIVKGMVPDATVVQVLCHGLPQLQSGIFVTKEMLRDLKSCSVEELYGSFSAIAETLLDKDACREVLPIALLMEHLAFQLIKDQEKVVHAATLKVKAMAQLGYLHRASIYLQDLMAGQSVAGFHYHRGVVTHQNLASKVTHKVFDDTKNLTDPANLEVFQAIAKLPVQAAVEEAMSKNAVNKIKLTQAEWVLKVCECCLNSPATQTATATPKADGTNLAKVKEVLGETLALVETVLEDSVVEDAPAEAEPPAESAPEGDGDGDAPPAAEAPTVNVALEANHLHAFLLLLAGKGLAGKVADVFGVAKRLVAYLRKLDKTMREAEPTVELVTLSAACWLKCRVALAMAYFCVGSHAHCIAVCETASAEASALQDYDTMATVQAVLANVEASDGEIEAALGRLTQACQLVAGAGNASKSLLLNLISIGDIQSKLGNMAEASRAWLAAEALLRASPDAARTLKENVYHPEMGTAYSPFPVLYAATMLRASLASTLAGDDARAGKQLAETMSIVENASNVSPHVWATTLALSADRRLEGRRAGRADAGHQVGAVRPAVPRPALLPARGLQAPRRRRGRWRRGRLAADAPAAAAGRRGRGSAKGRGEPGAGAAGPRRDAGRPATGASAGPGRGGGRRDPPHGGRGPQGAASAVGRDLRGGRPPAGLRVRLAGALRPAGVPAPGERLTGGRHRRLHERRAGLQGGQRRRGAGRERRVPVGQLPAAAARAAGGHPAGRGGPGGGGGGGGGPGGPDPPDDRRGPDRQVQPAPPLAGGPRGAAGPHAGAHGTGEAGPGDPLGGAGPVDLRPRRAGAPVQGRRRRRRAPR